MAASNANTSATSATTNVSANGMERELTLTRVFDAPREVVFKAWTDPAHLARWWGPKGLTNPVCEVDARPGGAWRIVMRSPDGNEYPCGGEYREVVEGERLVFTNIATDREGNPLIDGLTTVTFEEQGGKTKLTVQTRAVGLVSYAPKMLAGMEAGWTQSLERLAGEVGTLTSPAASDAEIVATRVFNAPRELVFQMWTDPEHIGRWYGPRGFSTTIHEMDVRPGGVWRFVMHGPDGRDYQNEYVYIEVATPERLVYNHVSAPKFQGTATFVEQGGRTEVTVRMRFESAALRDQVAKEYGAVEGLNQTLDRLGEQVAKRVAGDSAA